MKPASMLFAAALAALATASAAEDYKLGPIEIVHPWSRATPKGAKTAAGYMVIRNSGSASDRLVGGSIAVAGDAQVHEMTMDGGVMKMRPLAGGLEIKPGGSVELKPGGYHLMFMDLKSPLAKGQPVKGVLTFANAGKVDVEFAVEGMGAPAAGEMDRMKMQ